MAASTGWSPNSSWKPHSTYNDHRRIMLDAQHLATLLLRVAVAASLASILSRFAAFQSMLMREDRTLVQRVKLALSFGALYGACVTLSCAERQI